MAGKRRKKSQPAEGDNQEADWLAYRGRCRGPAWWSKYGDAELKTMQQQGRQLREEGYQSDPEYCEWRELLGNR